MLATATLSRFMSFSTGVRLLKPLSVPPFGLEHSREFTKKTKSRNAVITRSRSEREAFIVCY